MHQTPHNLVQSCRSHVTPGMFVPMVMPLVSSSLLITLKSSICKAVQRISDCTIAIMGSYVRMYAVYSSPDSKHGVRRCLCLQFCFVTAEPGHALALQLKPALGPWQTCQACQSPAQHADRQRQPLHADPVPGLHRGSMHGPPALPLDCQPHVPECVHSMHRPGGPCPS